MTKNINFRHRWKALVDFISYDHGIKMGESSMLSLHNLSGRECQISIFVKFFCFSKIVDIGLLKLNGCKIYLCQKDHNRKEK